MKIRHLQQEDIPAVVEIYAHARAFQVSHGNPNQWAPGSWPPQSVIEGDVRSQKGYVCTENDRICAVFYFDYGREPEKTYEIIDGKWMDDSYYGVVHRIASDHSVRGAGAFCLKWAYEQCGHLRIDTHEDNYVMQNLLEKLHFKRCGIIYLENGDPRFAYEKCDPDGFRIFETDAEEPVRVYADGNVWQSAVYLKPSKRFDPVFPYCRTFARVFGLSRSFRSILMIGGGMMTFPAYAVSRFRTVSVDVIEPDSRLIPLAEKFFHLNELESLYHPFRDGRIRTVQEEGREYLEHTEKTYDVILNDAFSGYLPAKTLCSAEAAQLIHSHLNPEGVYVVNVPGMKTPEESDFLLDEIRTLKEVFRYVLLLVPEGHEGLERDNYILFASDVYDRMDGALPYRLDYTAVITDRDTPHLQDFYESLNG